MRFITPDSPLGRLIKSFPKHVRYELADDDPHNGFKHYVAKVIPPGMFTEEEIEELRKIDAHDYEHGYGHTIANFLPDHLRPADVEKM